MTRLLRLAIALLPLALGTAAAGAQEAPRQRGPESGARMGGPREVRPRESLMQRGRSEREMPQASRPAREPARPPAQDSRSISDAVRRVQRTTGGQISKYTQLCGAVCVTSAGQPPTLLNTMQGCCKCV